MNPAGLMTKPLAKPKIEQLMGIMGYELMEDDVDGSIDRNGMMCSRDLGIQEIWHHGGELCVEGQQQWTSCVIVGVKSVVMPSRMRRHKHQRETLRSIANIPPRCADLSRRCGS